MEIDLIKLNGTERLGINEDISFDLEKYQNKDIVALKNMHVKGDIHYNAADNLEVNLVLTGIMILRDSVSLENLEKPLEIKIEEEYSLNDKYFQEYYQKKQNILDIMAILWENIVLEVPIRLTKTDNMVLSGDGWCLGEKNNDDDNINPKFAKLLEILDKGKE